MILVTGASGNVGKALVASLLSKGVEIRVGRHSQDPAPARNGVHSVALDLSKPETLKRAVDGVDRVFLLSPAGENMAELESNLVEAAAQAGVGHIVKNSIFPAVGDYTFGGRHLQVEQLIRSRELPFTFVRPNSFMQNMVNFFSGSIKSTGAFYLPARQARISHVDIQDVAEVACKALTEPGHEGKIYELTGPEALSFDQVADKLTAAVGKPIKYVDVPPDAFRTSMLGYGVPSWLVDAMINYEDFCARGGAEQVTDTVKRVLGRPPKNFDSFAREARAAFA